MVTVLLIITNINLKFLSYLTFFPNQIMSSIDLHSVEFEVYGKVQGNNLRVLLAGHFLLFPRDRL